MTKGVKILIGVAAVGGVALLFAFRKKGVPAVKKVGKIVIPDSSATTPDNSDLQKGSGDVQHILQLQGLLNELHQAVIYINEKCRTQWGLYQGTMPAVSGVFDDATENAMQFYLNRKTIDLFYLDEIRIKLARYEVGDKCKYPLAY
jgi:hypothetical protein